MAAASVVSSSFADDQLRPARPELDHAHAAEGEAVDLADAAVLLARARCGGSRVGWSLSGSRMRASRAGPNVPRSERAVSMEAEAVADVRRQSSYVDAAGLSEVAFGESAGDRSRLRPQLERARELRLRVFRRALRPHRAFPVADEGDGLFPRTCLRRGPASPRGCHDRHSRSNRSGRRRIGAMAVSSSGWNGQLVLWSAVSGTETRSNSGGMSSPGTSSSKTLVAALTCSAGRSMAASMAASSSASNTASRGASGSYWAVGCRRWFFWWLEVVRAAPDFAGER